MSFTIALSGANRSPDDRQKLLDQNKAQFDVFLNHITASYEIWVTPLRIRN